VKRPTTVVAACAALLTAGCSGSDSHQAGGTAPAARPSTQTTKMSEAPPPPASGRVQIRYEDAHTPEAQRGRELMQNAKPLDDLAQHVEDTLVLPSDMGAVAKQCDTVSDFYDPNANEVQLCYEAIQHSEQNFAGSGNPDPAAAAVELAATVGPHLRKPS
jgi:Putative metallopeptidase